MKRTLSLVLLVLPLGCSAACSDDDATQATTTGAGGAASSSSSGTTTSSRGSATTSTSSGTGGADSTFSVAPWLPGCAFEVADEPEKAMPPLTWEPCGTACERISKNWPGAVQEPNIATFSYPALLRTANGRRLGVLTIRAEDPKPPEYRSVVWDEQGEPLVVWRALVNGCATLGLPVPTESGVWMGAFAGGEPWTFVFEPYGALGTSTSALNVGYSSQQYIANDRFLALEGDFAVSAAVYDRQTDQTQILGSPTIYGVVLPQPTAAGANLVTTWAPLRTEGWSWTPGGGFVKLLDVQPKDVLDVKSDEQRVVWIETPPRDPPDAGVWPPGHLYVSPPAATPAELVPTQLRPMLAATPPMRSAIGGGYYAMYAGYDDVIQIVRLSDGYGWVLPLVEPGQLFTIAYLDDEYLVYRTTNNIYRIALAGLGPPSPPP